MGYYENSYYAGTPALVQNTYGKGKVYYYGSVFTEAAAEVFLEKTGVKTPYQAILELPECCELAVREKDGKKYYFVLNYSRENVTIRVKCPMRNLYTQAVTAGDVTVEAYGTRIFCQ